MEEQADGRIGGIGGVINGYTCVDVVGRGGSGVVYEAVGENGESVAVKVLVGSIDPRIDDRFKRECRMLSRLAGSPGIVPLLTSGVSERGERFLVMPLYEGGSLQQQIDQSGGMPWSEAVRTVSAVCAGVISAHNVGISHGDVKPANILIAVDDSLWLSDFGLSGMLDGSRSSSVGFSPWFSPPEAFIEGRDVVDGRAVDVYGLGALLWALIAGRPPFSSQGGTSDPLVSFGRIMNEPVENLGDKAPDWLQQAIRKAMAKQGQDRHETVQQFHDAIAPSTTQPTNAETQLNNVHPSTPESSAGVVPGVSAEGSVNPLEVKPAAQTTDKVTSTAVRFQPPQVLPQKQPAKDLRVSGTSKSDLQTVQEKQMWWQRSSSQIVGASALIVGGVLFGLLLLNRGSDVQVGQLAAGKVRDYTQLSIEDARKDAADNKWILEEVPSRENSSDPGDVLKQNFFPGTNLPEGKQMKITVSEGELLGVLPDFVDQSQSESEQVLASVGLEVVAVVNSYDNQIEEGNVVALLIDDVEVEAGDTFESSSQATLVISKGREPVSIPNGLVGKNIETVKGKLEDLGLKVVIVDKNHESLEEGSVIDVTPLNGVFNGDEVTVTVSGGSVRPSETSVPPEQPPPGG